MAFQKAVKRDAKLRLALCGPAGSGKTFTSLAVATALGGPVAYVDTEHGSASKYTHTDKCGGVGKCVDPSHFDFDVEEPDAFDPRDLIKFIDEAVAGGYRVICIDSLSHYWMGPGGELDLVDATAARSQSKNGFAAWKTVTPMHNALVDRILSAPIHVIVSMRTKTEWVIEKDDRGKNVPRKIGLAPVMRDGIEFEFDICGDFDQDNNFTVTKSRCSALTGKVINRPGKAMAETLREWCGGAPARQDKNPNSTQGPATGAAAVAPTGETSGPKPEEARNDVKSQTGPAMVPDGVPTPVLEIWARMGTSKALIVDELAGLHTSLVEQMGHEPGEKEYQGIVRKYSEGDPTRKAGFARRVVLELWKRIEALKAEDLERRELLKQPPAGELFPVERPYAD